MKHSEIIQANLDKRKTKKEKVSYLLYAYKEFVIGLIIGIVIIVTFASSFFNKTGTDFSVRVMTEQPVSAEMLDKLADSIQKQDKNIKQVDIQNIDINTPSQRQLIMAQMAAKEIDIFIMPPNPSSDLKKFVNEMVEVQDIFKLSNEFQGYSVGKAFNAPHKEALNALEK